MRTLFSQLQITPTRRDTVAMIFSVDLDIFHGPLDLLLYLVRKHEVEIFDLPLGLPLGKTGFQFGLKPVGTLVARFGGLGLDLISNELRDGDCREDADDGHHNHQFDKRKSVAAALVHVRP